MILKLIAAIQTIFAFSIVFLSSKAFGATAGTPLPAGNPLCKYIQNFVTELVNPIFGVIVAIMLIYAGILYITSSGGEEQIKTAKSVLATSIGGAILILLLNLVFSELIGINPCGTPIK